MEKIQNKYFFISYAIKQLPFLKFKNHCKKKKERERRKSSQSFTVLCNNLGIKYPYNSSVQNSVQFIKAVQRQQSSVKKKKKIKEACGSFSVHSMPSAQEFCRSAKPPPK